VISEIPFDAADLTRFDVYSLFGALVRAAVAKNQNSNPYSPAVQSELERLLPRETMQTFAASIDVQRIGYLVSQMIGGIAAQTQQSLRGPNGGYSGDAITPDLASALEYSIRDARSKKCDPVCERNLHRAGLIFRPAPQRITVVARLAAMAREPAKQPLPRRLRSRSTLFIFMGN
jgi:hypothetical protein